MSKQAIDMLCVFEGRSGGCVRACVTCVEVVVATPTNRMIHIEHSKLFTCMYRGLYFSSCILNGTCLTQFLLGFLGRETVLSYWTAATTAACFRCFIGASSDACSSSRHLAFWLPSAATKTFSGRLALAFMRVHTHHFGRCALAQHPRGGLCGFVPHITAS